VHSFQFRIKNRKNKEMIKIERVYDESGKKAGCRVLVDRLWPRGVTREKAKIDLWLKEIAPSDKLRKWFAHDPVKYDEFKRRYFKELKEKKQLLSEIKKLAKKNDVTLLYGSKEEKYNNAAALEEYLNVFR